MSKAFDKVNHYALFNKLMDRSIPREFLCILMIWYSISAAYVCQVGQHVVRHDCSSLWSEARWCPLTNTICCICQRYYIEAEQVKPWMLYWGAVLGVHHVR